MKKFLAEFIGTCVLVTMGCGTAMLVGCDAASGSGYLLTALAFGLVIVGMAYCVGNVSGCHINPAVSLGVLLTGGITFWQFIYYVIAQCLGAVAGAFLLQAIFKMGGVVDMTGALGANGLAGLGGNEIAGCLVECVLTFIFVYTILGVTSPNAKHGSFAGVVIGFTLVLVHIFGIALTGTSVNPARSLGPAIVNMLNGNYDSINVMWVFAVGPFFGAALAAFFHLLLEDFNKAEE